MMPEKRGLAGMGGKGEKIKELQVGRYKIVMKMYNTAEGI